jgi:hypothetical protein
VGPPTARRLPWERLADGLLLAALLATAALFAIRGTTIAGYPYELVYAEGALLALATQPLEGRSLYPDIHGSLSLFNPYPPVFEWSASLVMRTTGVGFQWGRGICLALALATAVVVGWTVFRTTGARFAGLVAGLFLLALPPMFIWGPLFTVDMPALFLAVSGLALLTVRRPWAPWLALFVFVAVLLTRHNYVAAPLAAGYHVYRQERRRGLVWGLSLLLAVAAIAALLQAATHGQVGLHLVRYLCGPYGTLVALYRVKTDLLAPLAPALLLLAVTVLPAARPYPPWLLAFWPLALASTLVVGHVGTTLNHYLPACAATALLVGHAYGSQRVVRFQAGGRARRFPIAALLLAQVVLLAEPGYVPGLPVNDVEFVRTPTPADRQTMDRVMAALQRAPRPVLCEVMGLPILAGVPYDVEIEPMARLCRENLWSQTRVLTALQRGRYGTVLLSFDPEGDSWQRIRFTDEMLAAIRERYTLVERIGDWRFYAPKAEPP